jgi:WD40 repeat protein
MNYISGMHKTRPLFTLTLLLGMASSGLAQEASYILKRQIYKVPLTSINISPDGMFLLAGYNDGSFRLQDPHSFEIKLEVAGAHYKGVNAMVMPPKMDFILTAGHNSMKLWDRDGKHLYNLKGHATTIWNVEMSSDGLWAVSSAMNKTFLLWDVYNGVIKERMRGHENVCMAVAISPDKRLIASGSNDLSINIWDLDSAQVITTLHGPTQDIYDVEFSPDSRLLVAASKDKTARLYDLEEQKLLFILKGHRDMVMEAEFSPDGNYLVTGSADRSLILWEVETGERIHQFLDNEAAVMDLVFHPDGHSFYSITYAGDLTRWELHPEIFVLKYYEKPYREELAAEALFEPRRKGESKKDYLVRVEEAAVKKSEIIARYYQQYRSERIK